MADPGQPLSDEEAVTTFERFKENARRLATAVPKERIVKRKIARKKGASNARRATD
jgi:hypothetical protein